MKVNKYVKILGPVALEKYYNDSKGNIYYREKDSKGSFQVVDGFELTELKLALWNNALEFIYIEGPSLGTNVEVEE